MKVLRLRFKNLNSLVGEWEIDFTHPDYVSNGIFAITGPTGAGKSTILDAICLACYGQTPRLSRISQSENEIMSRQTAECFAEVEFESVKGRFLCHWGQHRSRRQAGGQLQAPRHEIAEAVSGNILESKLKAVAAKVEEVTGMDFDRFTRSMLLAQGGFAAFLQARPDDRAPILEQITGTEIYSQISIKVHERTTEERKRLAELHAEINGIQFLTSAEESSLQEELKMKRAEEVPLVAALNDMRAAQAWREKIAMLEAELVRLDAACLAFAARKAAAAPDLGRLAKARCALPLAGDYAKITALRNQQRAEKVALTAIDKRLPLLAQDCQAASNALTQAETALAQVQQEQIREAELIRQAREFDVKIGEAVAQISGITADIEKQKELCGTYRLAIGQCDANSAKLGTELHEVVVFLTAHQVDAGLVEALTGIDQQLKSIRTLERQIQDLEGVLPQKEGAVGAAQERLAQVTTAFEEESQAVRQAGEQCLVLGTVHENLLQGRSLNDLRLQGEGMVVRLNRLHALQDVLLRVEETKASLAAMQGRLETLTEVRQALLLQEERALGALAVHEEVCRQLQGKVVLLNRVRDLEAERAQLVDGAPCPLCGASDHPYAHGNLPAVDEVQRQLEQAALEVKNAQQQLDGVRAQSIATSKDLEQSRQLQAEGAERLRRDNALCERELAELEVLSQAEPWLPMVRAEAERTQVEIVKVRDDIRQVERIEQEERLAQVALNAQKESLAKRDKARLAADLACQTALSELERIRHEAGSLRQTLDLARAEVGAVLADYAVEIVPGKADELLSALLSRRDAYVKHARQQETLQRGMNDLANERDKQQALLGEAEKSLADKLRQLRQKIAQRDELIGLRQGIYGARNPDAEEKRLAAELKQAGQRREGALQGHNRLQAESQTVHQELVRLKSAVAACEVQLLELGPIFARHLQGAGFDDEEAFLEASLPQADFDALQKWADGLRQEETEVYTRQQDRQAALTVEQERNLTDHSLEQIRAESAVMSQQVSELQQDLGAVLQKLQSHAEQQQRHQSRLQEIDRQRQECTRWERLHLLIGSSDGKKFRNFAQGLTFELMVSHANRQLQKMSDRYILVRDSAEPLELNVIDNYQAGEIRSTKNLSGGESFIASLALSLGLSSMASRTVRVDSLFLDEGFGTLDEDALETALETLSGLQQDGKLIGIISHVSALKERIGIQIQVEAGSAGRSSVKGPGCRRIE
ncbi:MAG: AAA family ATPase [Desulfobulbaceae bacterium]|nr:AAA family ATPase [Desulfobulbaceae bacterium]